MKDNRVSTIKIQEPDPITIEYNNLRLHMLNEADEDGIRYIDEISDEELAIVYNIKGDTKNEIMDKTPSDEIFRKLTKFARNHKEPYDAYNYYYVSSSNGFDFGETLFHLTGVYDDDIKIINDIKLRVDYFDFVFKPLSLKEDGDEILDNIAKYVKISERDDVDENEIGKSILNLFKNSDYYKGYIK